MGKVTLDIDVDYEYDGQRKTASSSQEISGGEGEDITGQGNKDGAITIARRNVSTPRGTRSERVSEIDPLPRDGGKVTQVRIKMTKVCENGALVIEETANKTARGYMADDCIVVVLENEDKNDDGQTIRTAETTIRQCCSDLKSDKKTGMSQEDFEGFKDEVRTMLADFKTELEVKAARDANG